MKSKESRISRTSRTIKNNTMNDLENILNQAENITLESLDFNKTFKEQGKILCDIKYMLSKNANNTNNAKNGNNIDKPFTCNPIISSKLNNNKFNELYQKFKKNYIISKLEKKTNSKKNIKQKLKTSISPTLHTLPTKHKLNKLNKLNKSKNKKISKNKNKKKSSKKKSLLGKNKRKSSKKYELNTRYPIVIIKKRTPRKNVIYLNK